MNITKVRVKPAGKNENPKLKAYVTVVLDNSLLINNIKLIQGDSALFLAMPSKQLKNGEFQDIVFPTNRKMRGQLESAVLEEYRKLTGGRAV